MTELKVVLPKEVAGAIEKFREEGASNWRIIGVADAPDEYHITEGLKKYSTVLNGYTANENRDTLLEALVNGYEVERTPHDELRDLYEDYNAGDGYSMAARSGIRNTLSILGITIEGINDNNTKGCE